MASATSGLSWLRRLTCDEAECGAGSLCQSWMPAQQYDTIFEPNISNSHCMFDDHPRIQLAAMRPMFFPSLIILVLCFCSSTKPDTFAEAIDARIRPLLFVFNQVDFRNVCSPVVRFVVLILSIRLANTYTTSSLCWVCWHLIFTRAGK